MQVTTLPMHRSVHSKRLSVAETRTPGGQVDSQALAVQVDVAANAVDAVTVIGFLASPVILLAPESNTHRYLTQTLCTFRFFLADYFSIL